jgi:hypothetical protein
MLVSHVHDHHSRHAIHLLSFSDLPEGQRTPLSIIQTLVRDELLEREPTEEEKENALKELREHREAKKKGPHASNLAAVQDLKSTLLHIDTEVCPLSYLTTSLMLIPNSSIIYMNGLVHMGLRWSREVMQCMIRLFPAGRRLPMLLFSLARSSRWMYWICKKSSSCGPLRGTNVCLHFFSYLLIF